MSQSPSIIIVGAGFAGLSAYLVLRKRLPDVSMLIIDQREQFTYIPALHNCLGKSGYLKTIQFDYKKYYGDDFLYDEVTEITASRITTSSGKVFYPEYIVIATGSRTNTFGNDNIHKYGYLCRFAEDIEKINKDLPAARSITVVGGGYTGVEIISTLAQRFPDKSLRIIHSKDKLVDRYSQHISNMVEQRLQDRGVEIIYLEMVEDLYKDTIKVVSGKTFQSDMTIFSAGIAINDDSYRDNLTFHNLYQALEGDHVYLCGDVSEHGLQTTAHNAMIEGRRIGNLVADKVAGISKSYPALENWTVLALALGTRDGIITRGTKGFFVPGLLGFCKRVIERRVMVEFMHKLMLWI